MCRTLPNYWQYQVSRLCNLEWAGGTRKINNCGKVMVWRRYWAGETFRIVRDDVGSEEGNIDKINHNWLYSYLISNMQHVSALKRHYRVLIIVETLKVTCKHAAYVILKVIKWVVIDGSCIAFFISVTTGRHTKLQVLLKYGTRDCVNNIVRRSMGCVNSWTE